MTPAAIPNRKTGASERRVREVREGERSINEISPYPYEHPRSMHRGGELTPSPLSNFDDIHRIAQEFVVSC